MQLSVVPIGKSRARDVAAEANHRIANSLSVIAGLMRMRGSGIGKKPQSMSGNQVRLILEEFGSRVDAVSRLHRLLAESRQLASVDLADYFQDLAKEVVSSLSSTERTRLEVACEPGYLVPPDTALSLGLVVVEWITNAIKYAHPTGIAGEVRLECRRRADGGITIDISDDGVGLPEDIDPMKDGHLGFRLVRSLADQLGATIAFHSDALGLSCVLQMPATERADAKADR